MLATSARSAPVAPQEGIDHLFLLPKRVLDMDNISLRKDLAGLDFDYQLFQNGPKGNVWLCKFQQIKLCLAKNSVHKKINSRSCSFSESKVVINSLLNFCAVKRIEI
jgi:hypothetical protein